MNLSLYTVAAEYRHIVAQLEDSEATPEAIAEALDDWRFPVEQKAVNVAAYCLNIEAEAEAIKQAEQRLKARRDIIETRAERLRAYLLSALQTCNISEVTATDGTFRIAIKNNPEKVELDESLPGLPAEFWREKITREPNKPAILAALKLGETVPGARLTRTQRLEIK